MGGDAYNSFYVDATRLQAEANERIAKTQGRYDFKVAQEQSKAVIAQAKYDYDARIFEAEKNHEVQMEALRVRDKESERQTRVDMKNAENDAVRAEASKISANAKLRDADAEFFEEQRKRERDQLRFSDSSSNDYWYGDAAVI